MFAVVASFVIVFNGQVFVHDIFFKDMAACEAAVNLVKTSFQSRPQLSIVGTCLNSAMLNVAPGLSLH